MSGFEYLLVVLGIINLFSFGVMGFDKRRSRRRNGDRRTPEGVLFLWAVLFGSVGIYLGMFAWRHKVNKWYFQVGIPAIFVQSVATIYLLQNFVLN